MNQILRAWASAAFLALWSCGSSAATLLSSQTEYLQFGGTPDGLGPMLQSATFDQLDPALASDAIDLVLEWSFVTDNGPKHIWFLWGEPAGVKDDSQAYGPMFVHDASIQKNSGPFDLLAADPALYTGSGTFSVYWLIILDEFCQYPCTAFPNWTDTVTLKASFYSNLDEPDDPVPMTAFRFGPRASFVPEPDPSIVPIPSAALLFAPATGLLGCLGWRQRRRTNP